MKVLASPDHHILDIPGAEQSSDHIIRLIAALFRLCEVEKKAAEAKLGHLLSPEVGRSLMWCLERWCGCYLLPVENFYSEVFFQIFRELLTIKKLSQFLNALRFTDEYGHHDSLWC